jgi:hypothetical protein
LPSFLIYIKQGETMAVMHSPVTSALDSFFIAAAGTERQTTRLL